jgi:predicted amidophosphoribosyltransferase
MNRGVFGGKGKKTVVIKKVVKKKKGNVEKKTSETGILEIHYKQDYDIREVHKIVLKKFEDKRESIPAKKDTIKKLTRAKEMTDNYIEKKSADKRIEEIEKEIKEIEAGTLLSEYLDKVSPIIERYNECKSNETSERSFGKRSKIDMETKDKSDDKEEERKHLVTKYFIIVKKYIDINVVKVQEKTNICSDCKIELTKEHGGLYCSNCGILLSRQSEDTSYKDSEKTTSVGAKNDYDKGEHIKVAIIKLQALQKDNIHSTLIDRLEKKLEEYGKRKSDLSIPFLLSLLKECNYKDYDDIYLIHTKLTGNPPFNCSEIQDRLFIKAEQISAVYNDVRPPERTNYISANYSVWSLLMMEEDKKWHLPRSYFTFTKNRVRLLEYDDIMQKICDIYGWKCPRAAK